MKKKAVKKPVKKRTANRKAARVAPLGHRAEAAAALGCQPEEIVFCLRTCDANLKSHGGFQWPDHGLVTAPDWNKRAECGNGLHGLARGEGGYGYLSAAADAKWLAFAAVSSELVTIDGDKIKVPRAFVCVVGDALAATTLIIAEHPGVRCVRGTSTSGDGGTSTSGDGGTSTSGYRGTSTSGDGGTSTSGDGGTSTSGYGGTSTSGECGFISAIWYDQKNSIYRRKVAACGDGVEAYHAYRLSQVGEWIDLGDVRDMAKGAEAALRWCTP